MTNEEALDKAKELWSGMAWVKYDSNRRIPYQAGEGEITHCMGNSWEEVFQMLNSPFRCSACQRLNWNLTQLPQGVFCADYLPGQVIPPTGFKED